MAKRSESRLSFAGIRIEGGLLLPDVLAKIAAGDAPEQQLSNYDIPPGLKLRDEVLRYWTVGRALWTRFEAGRTGPNPAAVRISFARDLLTKCLEFELEGDAKRKGGFQALTAKGGSVPIIISGDVNIDEIRSIPTTSGKPVRKTPSAWLQTILNGNSNALWGLALDGMRLRLLRDNNSLTRPAMIEVDLDRIFRDGLLDEFTVFWLLCHHTRFGKGDGNPDDCTLERWRGLGNTEGVTARDRLRDGVERAMFHLGTGFLEHPANAGLRDRLLNRQSSAADRLTIQDFHKQLLRLVYRLIFLMTAEDRGVLLDPAADTDAVSLFRKGYSTDRLRERSRMRPAWDRHQDAYQGIRVLNRAAAAGEERLGIPALGGIFGADQCPDVDDLPILNQRFLQALYHLSWMEHAKALVRINWRDMQTEELGSVYESLLELTPALTENATRFYFVNGEGDETAERLGTSVKGNARKTTGSYYTPDSLVQLLLDRTLDPVIDDVVGKNPGKPEALLELDIIDPACGSGHFLLGAARRVANKLAELRTEGSATEIDYRHAMRDVIGHCIYGVDRNEFAIELCRLALWLESIDPGRALSFLDSRIVCGDSLVGVLKPDTLRHGIPDEAYTQLTGDDKATATAFRKWNKELRNGGGMFREYAIPEEIVAAADELISMPGDDLKDVVAQGLAYRKLMDKEEWKLFKRACDAYVSAYFVPKKPYINEQSEAGHSAEAAAKIIDRSGIPTSETVYATLRDGSMQPPFENIAENIQALHWFLTFPSVVQKGGFDAVVGNPPWERIKLQEQEFFASRVPEIANAANKAARERMIAQLGKAEIGTPDRLVHEEFMAAKRRAEAASVFARTAAEAGGRYALTGQGDVNTYALFAELFKDLTNSRGRSGMVVPTGIATDATTAPFFSHLIDNRRLASLIDFENREKIFPAVDSRTKFSILSLGHEENEAEFSFFLSDPTQVSDERRRFTLSPAQISRINPNTKTAPVFRSQRDAELTAKIYRDVPVLIDESKDKDGNPWGFDYATKLFDMADDSNIFRTAAELDQEGLVREGSDWVVVSTNAPNRIRYLPLYEAKMIHQFDHRWATHDGTESRDVTRLEKATEHFEPLPRYWVAKEEVDRRLAAKGWSRGWLMGWRDITNATNERTVIATALPRKAVGHTLRLMEVETDANLAMLFVAAASSLVFDFVARQKIGGTHFTVEMWRQMPILPPAAYCPTDLAFVTPRALELTYSSPSMAPLARDLGFDGPAFVWNEQRRAFLRAELDAFFARKYGLTRNELRFILDPADVMGADYPSETFRGLRKNELAAFGEYRTARLVLQAWDRMERGEAALSGLPSIPRWSTPD